MNQDSLDCSLLFLTCDSEMIPRHDIKVGYNLFSILMRDIAWGREVCVRMHKHSRWLLRLVITI